MIWNLLHQQQLMQSQRQADSARDSAVRAERRQADTADQVARLALVTQAVWELVKEKHGLDESDLLARIQEIDLRDGKIDGKAGASIRSCLGCGRKLSSKFARCIYCGCENPNYSPFTPG